MPQKSEEKIEELKRRAGAPEVALQRIIQSGAAWGFPHFVALHVDRVVSSEAHSLSGSQSQLQFLTTRTR